LITHVFIFFGKDIRTAWKQARDKSQPDPHYQAMLKYKEVPTWWYLTIFVLCFLAGIIVNIKGHTTLAVWEYIVALILGFFVAPFSTILDALYGASVFTNQLSNMVGGIVAPGRPLANLYFSSWCHQVVQESIHLSSWMKIGQYTKVPPRALFWVQIYGSLLGPAFNYPIMMSIIASQRDVLLAPRGNTLWSGALLQQLNAESVSWSLATQTFGIHGRYPIVPLALLVGLGLPIIHWLVARCVPRVRKYPINTPIIATFAGHYYYGTTSWIWSSIAVGIFSQAWLRRRYPAIYNKYVSERPPARPPTLHLSLSLPISLARTDLDRTISSAPRSTEGPSS
jgi:OPT family oligopeptide transporter